jgi:S-methylmethionine-dependent homocysteine/selenocysteine methylase
MEKMMHTMSDKITEFTYVTRQKYGTDSYAAGYLSSMLDEMIREMRIRGTKEMKEMANYYERAITQAIIHNSTTENV